MKKPFRALSLAKLSGLTPTQKSKLQNIQHPHTLLMGALEKAVTTGDKLLTIYVCPESHNIVVRWTRANGNRVSITGETLEIALQILAAELSKEAGEKL